MLLQSDFNAKSPLDVALAFASIGLTVFPCRERDDGDYKMKAPYIAGGFKKASDDPVQIRSWWAKFPNALIGLVTGQEAGLFVLDVDEGVNKCGMQSLEDLNLGDLKTWTVKTQNKGLHFYFRYPPDEIIGSGANKIGQNIDHRANNGYVIAAGSCTKRGRYEFVKGREPWTVDLMEVPEIILAKLKEKYQPQQTTSKAISSDLLVASNHLSNHRMTYEEAVAKLAAPLQLHFVRDHWEGAPCPACSGGLRDRLTLKPDENGDAWLICNAGCRQRAIWQSLVKKGLIEPSQLKHSGFRWIEFPDKRANGTPKGTLENYRHLLQEFEITARYDVIAKTEEVIFPGIRTTIDNQLPSALTEIASLAARYGLPAGRLEQMVFKICDENPVNPILDWIQSASWDGESRVSTLIESVRSDEPRLTPILITKWLLSMVKALTSVKGYSSQGVLVLQGAQGLGKSRWLGALCPEPISGYFLAGHVLDPRNKDSVLATTRHWIVELGELDGTFRRSDVAALKAFLTSSRDVIRKPYGRTEIERPRRTGFAATVNEVGFLVDDTGNRRYFTVRCSDLNPDHGIDMQQMWAEVLVRVKKGETPYLTEAESEQLDRSNMVSMAISPIEDMILNKFNWKAGLHEYLSATQICEAIGLVNPTQYQTRQAAAAVRNIKGIQTFDRKAAKTFHMPRPTYR